MSFQPDLDAYFMRLKDSGSRAPTLATLSRIVAGHIQQIPFENLDILLGQNISIEPSAVEAKLVHAHRGGYCFEHNTLLLHVLRAMGFSTTPISARVRIQRERSFTPARTHLMLRVEIEGQSWLVDVGVGVLSPTAPLKLELDTEQQTPHETRRLVSEGEWAGLAMRGPKAVLYHQALLGDRWEDVCEFTLEEMPEIDREVANWFTCAHPQSHFRSRLIVARSHGEERVTLVNRELKRRAPNGTVVSSSIIASPEELLCILRDNFALDFDEGTSFRCSGLAWGEAEPSE